jgi:predicted phosphodiesterase
MAWFKKYNLVMKDWVDQNLESPKILISGHSHLPEINMQERFANSGSIKWGLGQYLLLEDGEITLHDCRY